MMEGKALGFYVILKEVAESVAEGKFDIGVSEKRYIKGQVLKVGEDVKGVKEGDFVLYDKMAAKEAFVNGELVFIVRSSQMQNDIAYIL